MKEYINALEFWNSFFVSYEPQKTQEKETGDQVLDGLFAEFADMDSVLDFGCGAGWASHSIALYGKQGRITAVDQGDKSIDYSKKTAELSGIGDRISYVVADERYLFDTDERFDGIFTCNVIDVVPMDVTERMLSGFARVLKKGGKAVIMINPFIDDEYLERIGMQKLEGDYIVKDGILRGDNMSDSEWETLLSRYFIVDKLYKFKLPQEKTTLLRRLFVLSAKQG